LLEFIRMTNPLNESTREKILSLLQKNGPSTVTELSEALGITYISVRHHLTSLLGDSLVETREERHGVGRPRLVYRLTKTALERNPARYLKFTNLLLTQMKAQLPPKVVEQILLDMASHMAAELRSQIQDLPLEDRIERLMELLLPEGFLARVEPAGPDGFRLTEFTCPYATISIQHPEMCLLDTTVFANVLGATVERQSCIRSGSDSCTFSIMEKTADNDDHR
jgi:DeoR family transcriptional regulator, suf operon transcriptional repressor